MAHVIKCKTLFDITATGVKSHYKNTRMPFVDLDGKTIDSIDSWNRARNQQRNWETLNQLISLRTLPYDISTPQRNIDGGAWEFEFTIDSIESISDAFSEVGALLHDCKGVPMIIGLDECSEVGPSIEPDGEFPNVWFWVVNAK